jgi:hypothetical protein
MSIKHKILKRLLGIVLVLNALPILVGVTDDKNKAGKTFVEKYVTVVQVEFTILTGAVIMVAMIGLVVWCFGGFEYEDVDDSLPI